MKAIINIITALFLSIAVSLAIFFGLSAWKTSPFPYEVAIVRSGSMEPTIPTGSVVTYRPESTFSVGDIVAYRNDVGEAEYVVIHRIIEIQGEGESQSFITQGDNNDSADRRPVTMDVVVGKVWFGVPFVGYLISWLQTPVGIVVGIVFPIVLLIYGEINTFAVKRQMKKQSKNSSSKEESQSSQKTESKSSKTETES